MTKKIPELIPIEKVCATIKRRMRLKKISRTSIYFYIQKRKFPRPLDFGVPRMWRTREVNEWIDHQVKGETKKSRK